MTRLPPDARPDAPSESPGAPPPMDPTRTLHELHRRGATRLRVVRFRPNRRTLWSLTRGGTAFNLHEGYRTAAAPLLDALARVARDPRGRSPEARRARAIVRRAGEQALAQAPASPPRPGPDAASPAQARWLRAAYRHLNRQAFANRLPHALPLRLSARMRSTLGWIRPELRGPTRVVGELALNADLLLPRNDPVLHEVLLHEMAHVEAWLEEGERGHGPAWKAIAHRVGCIPRARPPGLRLVRRRPGTAPTDRVPPPLPAP